MYNRAERLYQRKKMYIIFSVKCFRFSIEYDRDTGFL